MGIAASKIHPMVKPLFFSIILELPYLPGPAHNGGVITIGPDNNVYIVVGNLYSPAFNKGGENSLIQNVEGGKEADGRGGILRVTQDGKVVDSGRGILGDGHPLNMYYAYGIRNSFGIAFDPLTGNLWDTENGGYDEINLVEPGFNSGWNKISGSTSRTDELEQDDELVEFDGKGVYSDPELDLGRHIAPTSLAFLNSSKIGQKYEADLFVATAGGEIFRFSLNEDRTQLSFQELDDKIVEDKGELEDYTFAENLGVITDIEVGPDGYLYITEYDREGKIHRILNESSSSREFTLLILLINEFRFSLLTVNS